MTTNKPDQQHPMDKANNRETKWPGAARRTYKFCFHTFVEQIFTDRQLTPIRNTLLLVLGSKTRQKLKKKVKRIRQKRLVVHGIFIYFIRRMRMVLVAQSSPWIYQQRSMVAQRRKM